MQDGTKLKELSWQKIRKYGSLIHFWLKLTASKSSVEKTAGHLARVASKLPLEKFQKITIPRQQFETLRKNWKIFRYQHRMPLKVLRIHPATTGNLIKWCGSCLINVSRINVMFAETIHVVVFKVDWFNLVWLIICTKRLVSYILFTFFFVRTTVAKIMIYLVYLMLKWLSFVIM